MGSALFIKSPAYLATGSDGAVRWTSGIVGELVLMVLSLAARSHNSRTDIGPSTAIQRFFLAPRQLGVGILVKMRGDL